MGKKKRNMDFANKVLRFRAHLKLSQEKFAEEMKRRGIDRITLSTVNRWELGKQLPYKTKKIWIEEEMRKEGLKV